MTRPVLQPIAQLRSNRTRGPESQSAGLRRVGVRLAAQTVALLLIMLIVLEIAVYVIIQGRLLSSLEGALRARANLPVGTVCAISHLPCPGVGEPAASGRGGDRGGRRGGGPDTGRPGAFNPDVTPSDVSSVFISPSLEPVHADGALGSVILDRAAVQRALRTRASQGFVDTSYKGQSYLIYTSPLIVGGTVIGGLQNSISEAQYLSTLASIRDTLVIIAILGLVGSSAISAALVQRALLPIRHSMQRQRDFVADAAHELRTPLAIQRSVGEVAMVDSTIEDLQATVEQMLGENQHLARLVEDLSLLARADTNAISIDRQPVDLSELVHETSRELAYLAEEQGHSLEMEVATGVIVTGDILRLRQLLLILIDNALKHTPPDGTVTVRLSAPQGARARLAVSDSGTGIDPYDLHHIFDRFYRADKARTGEGAGLGLAIAKWIVEAHGGQIKAGNITPHGAIFTVSLPAARADAGGEDALREREHFPVWRRRSARTP